MRPLMIVGSINLDVSLRVPRLAALGETLMGSDLQLSPGGKGANQAHAARQDGAVVKMVGAVGCDGLAEAALARLEASGVDLRDVQRLPECVTGVAMIQVIEGGDNAISLASGANAGLTADRLDLSVEESEWARYDLLLQWELLPETAMRAATLAHAAGSRVILNLAPARQLEQLDLSLVDWCVLNEGEMQVLAEHLGIRERGTAAAQVLARHVRHGVVLTLGAEGLYASPRPGGPVNTPSDMSRPDTRDAQPRATEPAPGLPLAGLHLPAFRVQAVDTTGAGDTFCGVFAAALASGSPVVQALRRASAAAALACTQRGAQAAQPSSAETNQLLDVAAKLGTAASEATPTDIEPTSAQRSTEA